ncbi:glycosyltransferase [Thiohalorhabdus methylotrophus]|uniref:Glycosyltransferase n=1 Tax=Thiohalorhabdus methylotrophus TaxID=3242694 RepID=A0ABV4TZU0_9GAMM
MANLTIITINYNDYNNLLKTAQSIEPLLKNFEWVVVDGNSTDGSVEFLNKYGDYENVVIKSEKDSGIYDAMNKGVDLSNNEFLLFLNSGDTLQRDSIQKIDDAIENYYFDIFVFGIDISDSSGKLGAHRKVTDDLDKLKCYPSIPHQSAIISKDCLIKNDYFDLSYPLAADYHFFCKAWHSGYCEFGFFLDKKISVFYQDGVSSNLNNSLKLNSEFSRIQKNIFGRPCARQILYLYIRYLFGFIPRGERLFRLLKRIILRGINS